MLEATINNAGIFGNELENLTYGDSYRKDEAVDATHRVITTSIDGKTIEDRIQKAQVKAAYDAHLARLKETLSKIKEYLENLRETIQQAVFDGNILATQADDTSTPTNPEFKDVDQAFKIIAVEEDLATQVRLYVELAGIHKGRATEILQKAKKVWIAITNADDKLFALDDLVKGYMKQKDVRALEGLFPEIKTLYGIELKDVKQATTIDQVLVKSNITLIKRDNAAYDPNLTVAKKAFLFKVSDDDDKEQAKDAI